MKLPIVSDVYATGMYGLTRNLAVFFISVFLLVALTGMGGWPLIQKTNQVSPNQVVYDKGNYSYTFTKRSSNSSTPELLGREVKPAKVLILTRYRSGSSFVGDLFSHHPDVFYMFEPLRLIDKIKENKSLTWMSDISPGIMEDIFSCRFGGLFQHSLARGGQEGDWKRTFCTKNGSSHQIAEYTKLCEKHSQNLPWHTAHACRSFKHIVAKTIRINDASFIKRLIENNVKIIHLVRDPRGQISSILRGPLGKRLSTLHQVSYYARGICNGLTKILDDREELLRAYPHLRNSYLLVRYEDIALDPNGMVKQLYGFAGIDVRPEVMDWVLRSTQKKRGGFYSTERNSKATSTAWTKRQSWEKVSAIQKQCSKVLWSLGYDIMWSKEDLLKKDPVMQSRNDRMLIRRHI